MNWTYTLAKECIKDSNIQIVSYTWTFTIATSNFTLDSKTFTTRDCCYLLSNTDMSNCNTDSQSARNFCQLQSRSNKIYSPSNEYLERKECEIVKLLLKRVYWWYVVPEHREHILSFYRWNHTNHTHLIVYICARVLLLLCYMWHRLYWEHGNIYSIISPKM